ncbi:MAG: hypothetical protein JWM57_2093 [Phycisphaerales bacterium]|nr:hypothetical protein [Phycisphaerales bacterium]
MEDQRSEAPELELTTAVLTGDADGADALQVIPTDSPETAVALGDAFNITIHKKPDNTPSMKASKPVTVEANDSVVAALMGRPIGMAKPAAVTASETVSSIDIGAEVSATEPRPSRPRSPDATAQAVDPTIIRATIAESTARAVASVVTLDDASTTTSFSPTPTTTPTSTPTSTQSRTRIAVTAEPQPVVAIPIAKPPVAPAVPAVPPKRAIPVAPVWPSQSATAAASTTAPAIEKFAAKAAPPLAPRLYVPPSPTSARPEPIPAAPRPASPVPAIIAAPAKVAPASPAKKYFPPPELEEAFGPAGSTGAWWTIPLTFVGIAIVACAMLIPAADENRRDNYELAKIEQDVDYFDRQSAVNQDFLKRVNTDATLAERLAMRQLHQTRQGVKLAPINGKPDRFGASPYAMTRLDPPPAFAPYQPVPGQLSEWFLGGKNPQQMAGLGLVVAGAGVMLGGLRRRTLA